MSSLTARLAKLEQRQPRGKLEAVILAIHALDEAEKGGAPPAKLQRLRVVAERAAGRLPDDTKRALAALGA